MLEVRGLHLGALRPDDLEVELMYWGHTVNVMCLSHPEAISPPPVGGKAVFHQMGPWCPKLGDCCSRPSRVLST